jgi:hypothetical protein
MKYILTLLILVSTFVSADDLLLGQYAYHFKTDSREDLRSEMPLIGYSTEKYTVIVMRNSYNKSSVVLLRTNRADLSEHFTGAISIGAASGYEDYPSDYNFDGIIPVGYLSLDIHPASNDYGLIITLAPDIFIGAGLRVSF